ncbi:MAG: glycosyltransferase family 4 protein [Candidatus Methylumidiphilus sp.]
MYNIFKQLPSNVEKPNVVIIESGWGFGGSVVSLRKTTEVLRQAGWRVRLLVMHGESNVIKYLTLDGLKVVSMGMGYRRPDKVHSFLTHLKKTVGKLAKWLVNFCIIVVEIPFFLYPMINLAWWLFRWKPELVVLNNQYDGLLSLAIRLSGIGCRVIYHARGFLAVSLLNPLPTRKWPFIIANSFAVKDCFHSLGWPVDRVKVVYNSFDFAGKFEHIKPVTDESWATDNMLRVALVGRLEPWKGHELFLEVARLIIKKRSNVKFYVVGGEDASTRGRIAELMETAGYLGVSDHIVFLGLRLDVYRVVKTMDIVVLTSIDPEPFGNVIVEAMLLGRAVVAADEGGPKEIITHETDGLLVTPRNPLALTEAVERLLVDKDLRERLGKNAVTSASQRFSHARYCSEILDAYKSVLLEV